MLSDVVLSVVTLNVTITFMRNNSFMLSVIKLSNVVLNVVMLSAVVAFQLRLKLGESPGAYPRGEHRHTTRLERPTRDEHSSLLVVNYSCNMFSYNWVFSVSNTTDKRSSSILIF
jgi:hypothetical protein